MIRDGRGTKAGAEITRREMKAPDRFQVAVTHFLEWATARRRALLAALGVVVVAVIAAVAIDAWRDASRDSAGHLLYETLLAVDGEISPVPLPGLDRPVFKDEAQRAQAIVSAGDAVRREKPGSRAAATAALASGDARLALRQWDAALADFEAYLAATGPDDSVRFAALDGIARAKEGKGDLAGAAQAYARAGLEAPFYSDRATLERARVLALAGQRQEARKVLQAFAQEHKGSPLQPEAQAALARLGEG